VCVYDVRSTVEKGKGRGEATRVEKGEGEWE
jgi:hypothetical protein